MGLNCPLLCLRGSCRSGFVGLCVLAGKRRRVSRSAGEGAVPGAGCGRENIFVACAAGMQAVAEGHGASSTSNSDGGWCRGYTT